MGDGLAGQQWGRVGGDTIEGWSEKGVTMIRFLGRNILNPFSSFLSSLLNAIINTKE